MQGSPKRARGPFLIPISDTKVIKIGNEDTIILELLAQGPKMCTRGPFHIDGVI